MATQLQLAKFWGKKRANTSNVWDHFGFRCDDKGVIADKTTAVCKYCSCEVKYIGGSTSNLASHYNNHHMAESKQRVATLQPSISAAFAVDRKFVKTSTQHIMLQQKVAEYIIAELKPFNTVESQSFKNLCAALNPRFEVPSKTTISSSVIPKMYCDTKRKVASLLDEASSVAITADGWTSSATQSYITLTAHFISEEWKLINVGLQTRHTPESHTAENLKSLFENAFDEWKLQKKHITGVVDNAKNISKAWVLLQKDYINCFAHTMNLAVRKGLAVAYLNSTLMKTRKLVSHFHYSTLHPEALKKQQEVLNLPRQKLKMDVETRWNSTYDMIDSVLACKEAIAQVLISDKAYRHYILSEAEESLLEEVKDVLKPWKELTIRMSKEDDVTISLIAPTLHQLLNQALQRKDFDSELITQMKATMREDLNKRYQDNNVKLILHTTSLLDPRFKLLPFLSPQDIEAAQKYLEAKALSFEDQRLKLLAIKVEKLTVEDRPPLPTLDVEKQMTTASSAAAAAAPKAEVISPCGSPDPKRKKCQQDSFFDNFFGDLMITKIERSPVLIERFQEEFKVYISMDPVPSSVKVLNWWQKNEKQFPLIANVAKQMLCTPATSTPSERAFSKAGALISDRRAQLKPANVDKLLFLNKNYFLF